MGPEDQNRSGREADWKKAESRSRRAVKPGPTDAASDATLVAVLPDVALGDAAAEAAIAAGGPGTTARVGDDADRIASLRGEMREETAHTTVGPGSVGPFTREMGRGIVFGVAVWTIVGALVALPFAFIPIGGITLAARLVILPVVGAAAGATFGFVAGGATAAKGPAEPLAAEAGVTVAIRCPPARVDRVAAAIERLGPIRIDRFEGGRPVEATSTEETQAAPGGRSRPRGPVDTSGMPGDVEMTETRADDPRVERRARKRAPRSS